jgi:hypothetical protein
MPVSAGVLKKLSTESKQNQPFPGGNPTVFAPAGIERRVEAGIMAGARATSD